MPTWPRVLQKAGYETAYVGKYHMGEDNDEPRAGFDYFATHRGQGQYFDTEWRINGGERQVIPGYYTTVVTDLAEQEIRRQRLVGDARCIGHHADEEDDRRQDRQRPRQRPGHDREGGAHGEGGPDAGGKVDRPWRRYFPAAVIPLPRR